MSNYDIDPEAFYAQDVRPECDVCEDDPAYALAEFGGPCPDCDNIADNFDRLVLNAPDVPEDALMEFGLFGDC